MRNVLKNKKTGGQAEGKDHTGWKRKKKRSTIFEDTEGERNKKGKKRKKEKDNRIKRTEKIKMGRNNERKNARSI